MNQTLYFAGGVAFMGLYAFMRMQDAAEAHRNEIDIYQRKYVEEQHKRLTDTAEQAAIIAELSDKKNKK